MTSRTLKSILMATVAVGGVSFANVAMAQDGTPAADEKVTVTGSRIKRPQYQGNIPGVQIDDKAINDRVFLNATEILNSVNLVGGGVSLQTNPAGTAFAAGQGFADLLDLGTQRTLTLINGRRAVAGAGGSIFLPGNETGSQVDLNLVPVGLIERIDVLTVGGAAAYGSDAIAGVINVILKDDYEGVSLVLRGGMTEREDYENYTARLTAGFNFDEDRGNILMTFEQSNNKPVQRDAREYYRTNPLTATNYANNTLRNTAFSLTPTLAQLTAGTNVALGPVPPSTNDGIPGAVPIDRGTTTLFFPTGVIYQNTFGYSLPVGATGNVVGGGAQVAGGTQLIAGAPSANPTGATAGAFNSGPLGIFNIPFAPSALPGALNTATGANLDAAIAAAGGTSPPGATDAQKRAFLLQLLRNSRPTQREFLAANPGTPLNAFLGTFVGHFPDTASVGPWAGALPRTANPIRFSNNGAVVPWNVATLAPDTPGTLGGAPGGDGFNGVPFIPLVQGQDRQLFGSAGHYDLHPSITAFYEFQYGKTESVTSKTGAATNQVGASNESSSLVFSVDNPFLDAADIAAMNAAGLTTTPGSTFVLSRSLHDLLDGSPITATADQMRFVGGFKGDIGLLGRTFDWEVAFNYGRSEVNIVQRQIKDAEFILAIDAVRDGAGNIVCRSDIVGRTGANLPGTFTNTIRVPGAGGIPTDQNFDPTALDAAPNCKPLNLFGFGQYSAEARDYVTFLGETGNENEMFSYTAGLSGDLAELPGGMIQIGLDFEYREETTAFSVSDLYRRGRGRGAPITQTEAEIQSMEGGVELRIPLFGGDFTLPGIESLEITPAYRLSQLSGSGAQFRDIFGVIQNPTYSGDIAEIYSLAAQWKPYDDLLIRYNIQRAVRQPSIVELFLGGQNGFFNAPFEPCSPTNISGGPSGGVRRQNCRQALWNLGIVPNLDVAAADAFLAAYVPSTPSVQALVSGTTSLKPEKSDSWTVGAVFQPSWLPGFRAGVDYIKVDLKDQISLLFLDQATQLCYDSPTFPNTAPQLNGLNTCPLVPRELAASPTPFTFVNSGVIVPFYNAPTRNIEAYNYNVDYRFALADAVGTDGDWGDVALKANAYNLSKLFFSDDGQTTDGTIARPTWETQLDTGYSIGGFEIAWSWYWTSASVRKSGGSLLTIENDPFFAGYEAFSTHNLMMAYSIDGFGRFQLNVDNVLDYTNIGDIGYFLQVNNDPLGRRYTLSYSASF